MLWLERVWGGGGVNFVLLKRNVRRKPTSTYETSLNLVTGIAKRPLRLTPGSGLPRGTVNIRPALSITYRGIFKASPPFLR